MRRFTTFLIEKKEEKPKVETTGHLAHAGDYLYYGDPDVAVHHHEKMFDRLHNNAEDPNHPVSLKVDGGMVYNELVMQFQADILDVPVIRPKVAETTALGAAYAAGLAVGFWQDFEELRANWGKDRIWLPDMEPEKRDVLYSGWKKAVTRTLDWVE